MRPLQLVCVLLACSFLGLACDDGNRLPEVAADLGRVPVFEEPQPAGTQSVSCRLEADRPGQEWLGCGITAHYHTQFNYALQRGLDGEQNPLLDLLFAPDGLGCGFLVLRAVCDENADPWPPLTFRGGRILGDGSFALDDPPAQAMLEYLERYGVEVMLRPETAPAEWLVRGPDTDQSGNPLVRLDPNHYHDYAHYLALYSAAIDQLSGGNLWGLVAQNEPDYPAWWDYMLFEPEQLLLFVRDHLRPALDALGLEKVRLVGPDTATTWSLPDGLDLRYFGEELRSVFDLLDFHTYDIGFGEPDDAAAMSRLAAGVQLLSGGQPIMIEYGNATGRPEDEALGGGAEEMLLAARHLVHQLVDGRAALSLWFQGFWDQPANGLVHLLGSQDGWEAYAVPLNYEITPKYYTLKQFFHFAAPGSRVLALVSGRPDLVGVGFAGPAERLVLVLANTGMWQLDVELTLPPGLGVSASTFLCRRSSYRERFAACDFVGAEAGTLRFSLKPASITTLVRQ